MDREEVGRKDLEVIRLLRLAAPDLAHDHPDDRDEADEERQLVNAGEDAAGRQDIGDVSIANGVERVIVDLDRSRLVGDEQQRTSIDEPAGQGCDKGRDSQAGHRVCREEPRRQAADQDERNGHPDGKVPDRQRHGRHGPEEPGEEPDGKVDVPDDDDQRHAHGKHCDVSRLVQEVADVARGDEQAVRQDREDREDDDQGDVHPVAADVLTQYLGQILRRHGLSS